MSETSAENPIWFMRRALKLAEKGLGFTQPNPMVGAVLVKNGKKIGEGYHHAAGEDHAEIEAFKNCTESPEGATLYVTLEPCCHHGKTPPCVDAVIQAKIQKVVIASQDPSAKVNGKGIQMLKEAGIQVDVGLMGEDARRLNRHFFTFHELGRPFVTLKWAQSLDAKIGLQNQKILLSSESSLNFAHALRAEHQAILIGAHTALNDDPELTVRRVAGKNPLKVVLKGDLELPASLKLFQNEKPLILEHPTIDSVLNNLKGLGVISVLVEGGAQTHQAFIEAGLWDETFIVVCPQFLGKEGIDAAILPKPVTALKTKILGKDAVFHYVS